MHGWDSHQRALQLVSYLDETAINVAQELGDDELYDYDILVRLLGDRFDPASRVSASRSRFHGRLRRHHEDADSFADDITDLCRVGYPQSSPELRQELISEQFVNRPQVIHYNLVFSWYMSASEHISDLLRLGGGVWRSYIQYIMYRICIRKT